MSIRGSCENEVPLFVTASGFRHIEQSSGPSKIARTNPWERNSSLDAKGSGGDVA
jgi:hypothetical protein